MALVEIVAVLAILQFLFFGFKVGEQRRESGLQAPQMTGHDGFERAYRVQMNTLESLVAFLPLLLLAGKHWPGLLVALIGVVYLVGRMLYRKAYTTDPAKRGPGFMLSLASIAILLILALLGAVMALF